MENSNLNELWARYSQLEEQKRLTPYLVREMLSRSSQSELALMVKMGYSSVAVFLLLVILFTVAYAMYGDDFRFMAVSCGGIVLSIAGLSWSALLLSRMRSIDFATDTFADVRTRISSVKRFLRLEHKGQFVFMPLFLACVFPVIYMMVQGLNIFEEFSRVAIRVVAGYVLITIISVWIYRNWYFKKLDLFESRIKEYEELDGNT